jgi:hypothetical protein
VQVRSFLTRNEEDFRDALASLAHARVDTQIQSGCLPRGDRDNGGQIGASVNSSATQFHLVGACRQRHAVGAVGHETDARNLDPGVARSHDDAPTRARLRRWTAWGGTIRHRPRTKRADRYQALENTDCGALRSFSGGRCWEAST